MPKLLFIDNDGSVLDEWEIKSDLHIPDIEELCRIYYDHEASQLGLASGDEYVEYLKNKGDNS